MLPQMTMSTSDPIPEAPRTENPHSEALPLQQPAHTQQSTGQDASAESNDVLVGLYEMFPLLDKRTIQDVLRSQNGNAEQTVPLLLSLSGQDVMEQDPHFTVRCWTVVSISTLR